MTQIEMAEVIHNAIEEGLGTKVRRTLSKDVLKAFMGALHKEFMLGHDVTFYGLGSFKSVTRAPRHCRNVKTGEDFRVGERKTVTFKASSVLKEELNAKQDDKGKKSVAEKKEAKEKKAKK